MKALAIKGGEFQEGEVRKRKTAGVIIQFEDNPHHKGLGRIVENTIFINTAHPAYRKAKASGLEDYHVIASTAWVLSSFVEKEKSSQDFVHRFLAAWGDSGTKENRLLE